MSDDKTLQNNYELQKDDKVKVIRHIQNDNNMTNNIPIKN